MFGRVARVMLGVVMIVGWTSAPAQADPTNCYGASVFTYDTLGTLKANARGDCAARATRSVVAELRWDKNLATDPLVAKNTVRSTAYSHVINVSSCDGGNQRGYYARAYFTTNTQHHDTPPKVVRAC